ncbi:MULTISPECIES: hypothetical protein [unclassified Sphingobium]|uniref:hypothetical protein n=1 Tax=unclassified Sphingobium TaxID=2611147 RepID=UPI0007704D18|nr:MULTISPECIES: hypothetical protein [Sphingomonadaceae]AMK23997.1 PPE-repeat protein [Sphingobium sp. TKS]NML89229.1 hypothetical protein [Sphingobium sp. TB-6]
MIYKAFAAVTLIAAPIVVLTVQSFVPQTKETMAPAIPASIAAPTVQPAPPPLPVSDSSDGIASFGQPMPEAGKPFLTPGAGLPDAPAVSQPPVENAPPPPDEVPR